MKIRNKKTNIIFNIPKKEVEMLIEENPDYGIYHICGSGETTWYEFAKEIFKQANVDAKLSPCTTEEYPVPAKRPKYSAMENDGICENWKISLKKYLELKVD